MTGPERPIAADWLALRVAADSVARDRAAGLVDGWVAATHAAEPTIVDIGAGTGANRAYLAPRLGRPAHWVLLDHDAGLLAAPGHGQAQRVVGGIDALNGLISACRADLVTCSALLDLLTAAELDALVDVLARHRTPALFSLTVDGSSRIDPPHPDDAMLAAAFNEHQARDGRPGGAAAAYLAAACESAGLSVRRAETPWLLDAGSAPLIRRFLTERAAAAVEARPELSGTAAGWLAARLDRLDAGSLRVRIGHLDLLIGGSGVG